MRSRMVPTAILLAAWGCSGGQPDNDALRAGSQALVVLDEVDLTSLYPRSEAALWEGGHSDSLTNYVGVPPGTRVTVGDDPGYYEQHDPELVARYTPPHQSAKVREVMVVVETGPRKGVAGSMRRSNLRPAD